MLSLDNKASENYHREIHRNAYNAAFYELGLKWHWDIETFEALALHKAEKDRMLAYLQEYQSHLLKVYEVDFLVQAIECAKANNFKNMAACSPKALEGLNWDELHRHEIGV
jgi:hypothetical protein